MKGLWCYNTTNACENKPEQHMPPALVLSLVMYRIESKTKLHTAITVSFQPNLQLLHSQAVTMENTNTTRQTRLRMVQERV